MGSGHRQKMTALSVTVYSPLTASETHSLANLSAYLEDDSTDQIVARTMDAVESGDINSFHHSAHEIQGVHSTASSECLVTMFCMIEVKISHHIPQFPLLI